MKIVICSSMQFSPEFTKLKVELEGLGHIVTIPEEVVKTENGTMSIRKYIEVNGGMDNFPLNHEVWMLKANTMRDYLNKVSEGEAVLVTNYSKKGIDGYIGGNTFMEMGYAFGLGKKIFTLFKIAESLSYKDEIFGLLPVVLDGDLSKIK